VLVLPALIHAADDVGRKGSSEANKRYRVHGVWAVQTSSIFGDCNVSLTELFCVAGKICSVLKETFTK